MMRKLGKAGRSQDEINKALDRIPLAKMPEYLASHPDLLTRGVGQHLTLRAISEVAHGDFDRDVLAAVDRLKDMRLGTGAMSVHRVVDESLFQDLRTEMGTYMSMDGTALRCGEARFGRPSDGVSVGALCEALDCIDAAKDGYDRTWNFRPGVISEENKMPLTDVVARYRQRGEIEKSQSRRCMERIVHEFPVGTEAERAVIAEACMMLAGVRVSNDGGDFQRSALNWDFAQEYGDFGLMPEVNAVSCGVYGILKDRHPSRADSVFNYNPPGRNPEDASFDAGFPVEPLPTYIGVARPVQLGNSARGMEVCAQRSQLDLLAHGLAKGNPFAYTKYERHEDGSVHPTHTVIYTMEEWNALLEGGMEGLPVGRDYLFAVRGQVNSDGKIVSPHGKEMGRPLFLPYEDMLDDQESLTMDVRAGALGRQTRPGLVSQVDTGGEGLDVFFVPSKPGEFAVIPDMRTSGKNAVPVSGIEPVGADLVKLCYDSAEMDSGEVIHSGHVDVTGDPDGRMFVNGFSGMKPAMHPCTVRALNASIDMMRARQYGMDGYIYRIMENAARLGMEKNGPVQAQVEGPSAERSLAGMSMPTSPQRGMEYDL